MILIKNARLLKILTNGFAKALTLYPFIIVDSEQSKKDRILINHERIHLAQQVELLLIGFYILYFFEYLLGLLRFRSHNKAYYNISFEREAYAYEADLNYLKSRKMWSSFSFMVKP